MNTSNLSLYSLVIMTMDHQIYLRFLLENKVAITDSTIQLGTINFNKIGLNSNDGAYERHLVMHSDGGNGLIMTNINSTGTISTVDYVSKDGGNISTGHNLLLDYTWLVPWESIDDSVCNKFYWKKIA